MHKCFVYFALVIWASTGLAQSTLVDQHIRFYSKFDWKAGVNDVADGGIYAEVVTGTTNTQVALNPVQFQADWFETRIVTAFDEQTVVPEKVRIYQGQTEFGETVFAAQKGETLVAKLVQASGQVQAFETDPSTAQSSSGDYTALSVSTPKVLESRSKPSCGVSTDVYAKDSQPTFSSSLTCISGSMSVYVDYSAYQAFGESLERTQLWTLLAVAESASHYANATGIEFELDIAELIINPCETCETVSPPSNTVNLLNKLEDYEGFAYPQTFKVLITGREVSNDRSVVGIALLDQVCTPQSLAAIEVQPDNFLTLGLIITHEIGHVLGMTHDDNGLYYMSPELNYAFEWSQASLAQLQLAAGRESCWETCGYAPAYPRFVISKRALEEGQNIEPYDETTGPVIGWFWDAPGSAPYDTFSQTPLFHYDSAGTYEVKLRVNDVERGWTDFTPVQLINVLPKDRLEISCLQEGDSVAVVVDSRGLEEIRWTFRGIQDWGIARPLNEVQLNTVDTMRFYKLVGMPDAEVLAIGLPTAGRSTKAQYRGCRISYGGIPKVREGLGTIKLCSQGGFDLGSNITGRADPDNGSFLLDKSGRGFYSHIARKAGTYDVHWRASNYFGTLDTITTDQVSFDLDHDMVLQSEAVGSSLAYTALLPFDAFGFDDTYHWTLPDGTTVVTDDPTLEFEPQETVFQASVQVDRYVDGCSTDKRASASQSANAPVLDLTIALASNAKPLNCVGDTITFLANVGGADQNETTARWKYSPRDLRRLVRDDSVFTAVILARDNIDITVGYEAFKGLSSVTEYAEIVRVIEPTFLGQNILLQEGIGSQNRPFGVKLNAVPFERNADYIWSFDGVQQTNSYIQYYQFDSPGTHSVELSIGGACPTSHILDVELPTAETIITRSENERSFFGGLDEISLCPYDDVNLVVDVANYAYCEWSLPGAVQSSLIGDKVTVQYPTKGIFETSVTIHDLSGRTTTVAGPTIHVGPIDYPYEISTNSFQSQLILRDYVRDDYVDDIKWYTSDGTLYEGRPTQVGYIRHTPRTEGFLEVRFQVDTRCGRYERLTFFNPDGAVSTNQLPDIETLVYPNPTRSRIYVKLGQVIGDNLDFILLDALGRSVGAGQLENTEVATLELTDFNLSPGLYRLVLGTDSRSQALQFIVSD